MSSSAHAKFIKGFRTGLYWDISKLAYSENPNNVDSPGDLGGIDLFLPGVNSLMQYSQNGTDEFINNYYYYTTIREVEFLHQISVKLVFICCRRMC